MTAIYKTGTVSVNNGSNIVTGSGTSFIDVADAQLGDLFTVDGQKFYEIYEVDTNTQIKIRNLVTGGAFAETNVSAGNFAIIRNFTSQTSAEIAGKVLAVQQKWMNREEEMTDWFYTANDWATVTSINGDELNVMTPNGINNLLAPGAFGPDCRTLGLGIYYNADAALISRSTESNLLSGLYTAYSPNNANASIGVAPIPSDSGAYSLLNMQGVSSDDELYTTQLAMSYDPNLNGMFFRTRASGSFGGWNTIYHSGNTNFNTWDIGAGRVLTQKAISPATTIIDVELPLNSWDLPTGITINVGSCDIIDADTGTTVYSDVTPTLAPPSHRRLAILRFAVTGATTGKIYRVVARNTGFGFSITF